MVPLATVYFATFRYSRGPPIRRYPYIRRYLDIRGPKSLGVTGELHSLHGVNKVASLYKAFMFLSHTAALLMDPSCTSVTRNSEALAAVLVQSAMYERRT